MPGHDAQPHCVARRAASVGAAFLVIVVALLELSIRDLQARPKLDSSIRRGQALFAQHHCLACHGVQGEGGQAGPDLSSVGKRRPDRDRLMRHLQDQASASSGSVMPTFPLSGREMDDLVGYLLSLKSEVVRPAERTRDPDETEYAWLPPPARPAQG